MNFEELKARYLAGETDLTKEAIYIFDQQGETAAQDFARVVDEELGASAYENVQRAIKAAQDASGQLYYNQKAAAELALKKAQQDAKRMIDSADAKAAAEGNAAYRRSELPASVTQTKKPLLLSDQSAKPGQSGTAQQTTDGTVQKPTKLYFIAALVIIAYLLMR